MGFFLKILNSKLQWSKVKGSRNILSQNRIQVYISDILLFYKWVNFVPYNLFYLMNKLVSL